MRKTKSLLALLCAVVAAFVLAVPAFAEPNSHTLTITSDTGGHTYEAYQVFKGDISSDGTTLSNIKWGDNISDGGQLVDALVAKSEQLFDSKFTDGMTAAQVASVLESFKNNSTELDDFAAIVGGDHAIEHSGFLSGTPKVSTESGSGESWVYTIAGLAPGYYLVQDADTSPTDPTTSTKTKFILKIIADATANAKDDTIPLDKEITGVNDEETKAKAEDAAIGDVVKFTITSTVPKMDGYNFFKFIIKDTLSAGLTYNPGSLHVYAGETELTEGEGNDYILTAPATEPEANATSTLSIAFVDILHSEKITAGQTITVVYTATVDDDAVIGVVGNPNDVKIQFSNDPNFNYDGKPDFSEGEPSGETPNSTVRVYVTGLQLKKVDEENSPLTGAQFQISGTTLNTTVIAGFDFVQHQGDGQGAYWKLTNGTYTTTAPEPDGSQDSYYADTNTTYDRVEFATPVMATGDPINVSAWVDDDGILRVDGLKAGEYTITEVTAPNGYNKIDPITVNIGWTAPQTGATDCTWTVTSTPADMATVSAGGAGNPVAGTIMLTIQNRPGATLPSTGGIGTTIFYAVGATLVIGAGVVLVSRYRANRMK